MHKSIKSVIFLVVIILCAAYSTSAQIKVVGDDYTQSLSAKDYYSQDVGFESYFPQIDPKLKFGLLSVHPAFSINLIGDTVWLSGDTVSRLKNVDTVTFCNGQVPELERELKMKKKGYRGYWRIVDTLGGPKLEFVCVSNEMLNFVYRKSSEYRILDTIPNGLLLEIGDPRALKVNFAICNGRILRTIPSGYYVISGYIFGKENIVNIFQCREVINAAMNCGDVNSFKRAILINPNPRESHRKETVREYLGYMKMTSLDTTNGVVEVFYRPRSWREYGQVDFYSYNDIFLVRSYNELRQKLLHKEVVLCYNYSDEYGRVDIYFEDFKNKEYHLERKRFPDDRLFKDDMTQEQIKQQDDVFVVKDIVIKRNKSDYGDSKNYRWELYCVLQGEKTGSFALRVNYTSYNYTYFAESNGKSYRGSSYFYDCPIAGNPGRFDIVPIEALTTVVNSFADKVTNEVKEDTRNEAKQKRLEKEAEMRWQQQKAQEVAEHKQNMIAKYGEKIGELVASKQVALNFTKEMVKDAWSKPMNTYRTTTKYGQTEVWCYNYKTRVYFHNGKVIQIDD